MYRYFIEVKDEVDKKIGKYLKDNFDQMMSSLEDGIKRVWDSSGGYVFIMEEIFVRFIVGKLLCDFMFVYYLFIWKIYFFGCIVNIIIC